MQRCKSLQGRAGTLEQDNRRGERLETAEALKTFPEHVTRLVTVTIDGLGR